jgi:hypothetical protein
MTQVKVILVCLLNALCYKQIQSYQYNGDGTGYGGSSGGFCGFKEVSLMHVALNSEQWNNSLDCGRCVSISYKDSTPVTAMITDICPECKYGDLDMYTDLYNTVIKQSPGREKISWDFVNCPNTMIEENIKLSIHSINYYWLAITPIEMKCGVTKMEIMFDNEWIEMDRNDDITGKKNKMNGLYFIYHNFVKTPFQLKLTSIAGDVITTPKYDKIEDVLITNQQFKCDNQNEPDCSLPMATEQPTTQPPKVDQTPLCVCK